MRKRGWRSLRVKSGWIPLLLIAMTSAAQELEAQVSFGPDLRMTYVKGYDALLFGFGATISGRLGNRTRWTGSLAWHFPASSNYSYSIGPEALPAGDTTSRTITGTDHQGLLGGSLGMEGPFGQGASGGMPYWKVAIALDDLYEREEYEVRYAHTGEVRAGDDVSHDPILLLYTGFGYHFPVGPGILRIEILGAIAGMDLQRPEPELLVFPVADLLVGYQWLLAAR